MIRNNRSEKVLPKRRIANWMLVPVSILTLYLFLEILTYLLICSNVLRPDFHSLFSKDFGASDMPYVCFDSISGYKYSGHRPHLTNINNGHVVYEHSIPVNNKGYCSIYDYDNKKKTGCKRWMVFGDSYTAGEITDTTWTDLFQKKFNRDSIEFYNFSLEGAGISNWHSIFFKEVVPNYEFDGIVLAVFGDLRSTSYDLTRDFIIKHSFSSYTGLNFFPVLPETFLHFEKEYKQQLFYESSIYNSENIEKYKTKLISPELQHFRFTLLPPKWYFSKYLIDAFHFIKKYKSFQKKYASNDMDPKILSGAYKGEVDYDKLFGKEKMQKVEDILNYCHEENKKIYLISIPSFNLVSQDSLFYHNNLYNRHLKFLAAKYQCDFFDGYQLYDSIPPDQYDKFLLYGDSHWNRKGIDLFVKILQMKK